MKRYVRYFKTLDVIVSQAAIILIEFHLRFVLVHICRSNALSTSLYIGNAGQM